MSRTNDHKEVIMEQLAPLCPSLFYQISPDSAGFPRAVYELRQLSVKDYHYEKHIVTLHLYDKNADEALQDTADSVISVMDGKILETDGFYYQFFYNQDRQPVPEQEKSLRHIMLTFEIRIYTRSEF